MQKNITIKLNKNIKSYGSLDIPPKLTTKLIIFVHGFLSNQEHHLFYNSVHFFPKKGYATFRYNLYGYQKDARKINTTNLQILAQDLSKIIASFKKQYSQITVVSHSLGAFVVLLANLTDVSQLVFWEPSLHPKIMLKNLVFDLGYEVRINKKIAKNVSDIPSIENLLKIINKPIVIINAEKTGKPVGKYPCITILGAGHNFDEAETEKELFEATLEWLKGRKRSG